MPHGLDHLFVIDDNQLQEFEINSKYGDNGEKERVEREWKGERKAEKGREIQRRGGREPREKYEKSERNE